MSDSLPPTPAPSEPTNTQEPTPGASPALPAGPPSKLVIPPIPGGVITSEMTGNSYTMGEKIGEGHFGIVFSCVDVWGNKLAAKVMKPLGSYENVRQSTTAEFQKLLVLRHPNITYLFDAWEFRDTFYLITERCDWSLADLMNQNWFSGGYWVKPIARCLLQAVHYIHLNRYCHQDIHPGNVFAAFARNEMAVEGAQEDVSALQFKLGDLGVAKLFHEVDATNTRNLGMLPPEALDSSEFGLLDHRIDIYHCGLLLLQIALSKEIRFTEDEIKTGKPKELALQLQPPVNFALEKALRRHVAFRTQSAMELWRDLSSAGVPAQPQPEQLSLQEATPEIAAVEPPGGGPSL